MQLAELGAAGGPSLIQLSLSTNGSTCASRYRGVYRLNVFPVQIPPLCERQEGILHWRQSCFPKSAE